MTKDTRNGHPAHLGPGRHYAVLRGRRRRRPNPWPRTVAVTVFFGILIGVLIGFALGMAVTHLSGMVEVING